MLANRFIYHFAIPHRGEIVVFNTPPRARSACGAGGVVREAASIGLPGDVWQERNGCVYINGKRLTSRTSSRTAATSSTYPPRKIPKDDYFMMGDNRASSCDSRRWGTVPRENIIGKVFAIYWPPQPISSGALRCRVATIRRRPSAAAFSS